MRIGIIGLAASGKTTVYRLLTHGQHSHQASRAGEASIAVVRVHDPRLDRLAPLCRPKKVTPATVEFIDLAPLSKGPGKVESAAGQLMLQMRQTDALLAVLRGFQDEGVPHPEGRVNPTSDAITIQEELLLADLDVVEKRISRIEEGLRKGKKDESLMELALLKRCHGTLERGRPLREMSFPPEEDRLLRGFQFLTAKPLLFLVNVGEEGGPSPERLETGAATDRWAHAGLLAIPAKLELELTELPPDEASAFRTELGLNASSVPRLFQACLDMMSVLTFFTVVGDELRAWTIPRGTTALKAAGTVHSDMERGFIRAEVVASEALIRCGSLAAARKEGLVRLEGKDYVVADGDVITIRFNI